MKNFFSLTDDQIKDIFDNCRNLGICGALFAGSKWLIEHIESVDSAQHIFAVYIFVLLVIIGAWLCLVTQLQAFRKLKEYGHRGAKLVLLSSIYNLVVVSLLVSIYVH